MATSRACRFRLSVLRFAFVLVVAGLGFGQSGQVRHLAYSTYNVQPGDITMAAANATGVICVGSYTELYKLNSDGTLAYYKEPPSSENVTAIGIDSGGDCYLSTRSGNIPMTVSKYDARGNLVYTVNYQGSGTQFAAGMGVDGSGNLWLTGGTSSNDLPLVNPLPGQNTLKGNEDAFIAEFDSTGILIFSTYFGGSGSDGASALALDASGNVYITGSTGSTDFPLQNPLENTLTGSSSAFLSKVDSTWHLIYSTYLGTTVGDNGCGVAADTTEDMLLTGSTSDGSIIVKLNPAGSTVLYSAVPTHPSYCAPIAVDSQGNAYTAGAFQPLVNPIQSDTTDAELVGLDPNGNVVFASDFGNSGSGDSQSLIYIGVDSSGNLYTDMFDNLYYPVPILDAVNGAYPYLSTCQEFCGNTQSFVAKVALGTGPSFAMPATVTFRPTPVGQTDPNEPPVSIYNTGSTNITISSISISGDFSGTNNCPLSPTQLATATKCTFNLTFTPTAPGTRTGAITIIDDSPGSPHIIQLTGTGLVPVATVSPSSLDFGSEYVGGTTAAQTVTLQNTGGASLNISRIETSGDFAETNNCPGSLDPAGSCAILVTFSPTMNGTRNGTLTVIDDAANSPQTVSLTGIGTGPNLGLGVAPGSSSSQTVSAGGTAKYTLAIGGQGVSGTATLTCSGAPSGATCTVPASENVSGTSASTFPVSVTTTARNSALLLRPHSGFGWMWAVGILSFLVLPGSRRARRGKLHLLPFALLLFLCSCGGGSSSSSSSGTPVGTYTITVTATMGSNQSSTPLTLIVQ
jgi:hypothetical protein